MSNKKFKNIYNQPKAGNEQAQMMRNTLGGLIEQSKGQKHATSQRQANEQATTQTNAKRVFIELPKANKRTETAIGWSQSYTMPTNIYAVLIVRSIAQKCSQPTEGVLIEKPRAHKHAH